MDMMLRTEQQSACVGWLHIHERRGTANGNDAMNNDATDDDHTTTEENT